MAGPNEQELRPEPETTSDGATRAAAASYSRVRSPQRLASGRSLDSDHPAFHRFGQQDQEDARHHGRDGDFWKQTRPLLDRVGFELAGEKTGEQISE
jgi:hypothetical protein